MCSIHTWEYYVAVKNNIVNKAFTILSGPIPLFITNVCNTSGRQTRRREEREGGREGGKEPIYTQ